MDEEFHASLAEPDPTTDLGHIDGKRVPPTSDGALVCWLAGMAGWGFAAAGLCPLLQGFNLCLLPLAPVAWIIALAAGLLAGDQLKHGESGYSMRRTGMAAAIAGLALSGLLLAGAVLIVVAGIIGAR